MTQRIDISKMIIAKSDQLNADDLLGGEIIITITKVEERDSKEQPLLLYYEGCNDRPWKPCLSMRRVLGALWGQWADEYIGRSLTLHRDPKVKWAGAEVGGVRITHMSHIDSVKEIVINATKGKKAKVTIHPLTSTAQQKAKTPTITPAQAKDIKDKLVLLGAESAGRFTQWLKGKGFASVDEIAATQYESIVSQINAAVAKHKATISVVDEENEEIEMPTHMMDNPPIQEEVAA